MRARAVQRLSSVSLFALLMVSGFLLTLNASPCLAVPVVYTLEGDPDVPGVSGPKLPEQSGGHSSIGRGGEEQNPQAPEVRQITAPRNVEWQWASQRLVLLQLIGQLVRGVARF